MNKTFFFANHFLTRVILLLTIFVLFCSTSIQSAQADAAPPPDPTVGGIGPYQPQKTNVQMMSETVLIDVPAQETSEEPKQIKVNARFTMRNQGQAEEKMQVIFPLTRLNYGTSEQALYEVDAASFVVKVGSQLIPTTEISTPPEISASDAEHGFAPEVRWAAFEVTFPVHQDVLLQVQYNMLNGSGMYGGPAGGFTGVAYILETGAGWYGNILSADITLRLPYPVSKEVISDANPGYTISGNEMDWKIKNFEPARKDNLTVSVIHSDIWQTILELRSRVEQYPDDAEAWAKLGDKYMGLAVFMREGIISAINQHFADLTVEARQKVVALRPEWGDAHYKLAETLWYTNPGVKNRFRIGGKSTSPDIHLDDPAIQRVLQELQLAWSYGTTESNNSNFLLSINQAFPELRLMPPGSAIATLVLPTETPTLTPTVLVLPTYTPTPTPAAPTKIPSPTVYGSLNVVILIVVFLIVIGVLVYLWHTRFGSRL